MVVAVEGKDCVDEEAVNCCGDYGGKEDDLHRIISGSRVGWVEGAGGL